MSVQVEVEVIVERRTGLDDTEAADTHGGNFKAYLQYYNCITNYKQVPFIGCFTFIPHMQCIIPHDTFLIPLPLQSIVTDLKLERDACASAGASLPTSGPSGRKQTT